MKALHADTPTLVTDSPLARFLFGDVRLAWLWLPLRLWVGWDWLTSTCVQRRSWATWLGRSSILPAWR